MNANDISTEPSTVLELALGYSNQCILKRLDSDSGAGANAGSKVDMSFVGTDPLSELVWSPQKGLSLRCADGSFSKKKPHLILCAERSDIVGASSVEKVINQANLGTSPATLNMRSEGAGKDIPINLLASTSASADRVKEMKTKVSSSFLPGKEHPGDGAEEDSFKVDEAENDSSSVKPTILAGGHDNDEKDDEANLMKKKEDLFSSEVHPVKEYDGYISKLQIETSTNKGCDVTQSLRPGCKIKSDPDPPGFHCLEKWESTAENDLQTLLGKNTYSVATKVMPSESSAEVRINSQPNAELLAGGRALASHKSLRSSRIQRYQKKGKGKSLSDGFANGRTSNEKDNSNESVESCNSAGLFLAGKKRWSIEQSLIVGRKRLKRRIQDSPCSSSFVKQDSSFMNWIANMMKGFLSSKENAVPSSALTLANPDHGHKVPEQCLLTCNRNGEPADRRMGFQSFFGSLYCPKRKAQDSVALNPCNGTEESRQSVLNDNICDVGPMPITCRATTGSICKRFKLPNEKFSEPAFGKGVNPVFQAKDTSTSFTGYHEIRRSVSVGNQNSLNLATDKNGCGTISDSSQAKHEAGLVKNINSGSSSDEKTDQVCTYKSDPMKSLWITHFTPKSPVPLLNQDPCNQSTSAAPVCSTDSMGLKNAIQNHLPSLNANNKLKNREHLGEVSPPSHNCGTDAETSFSLFKVKGFDDERSACQVDTMLPSPRIKHSKAMASVFARRLDALKHIMPSDSTDNSLSGARNPAELGACFVCECGPVKFQLKTGNTGNMRPLDGGENQFRDDNAPTICHENDSWRGKYCNCKPNEDASSQHKNAKLFEEDIASGLKGHKSKVNSFTRCSPFHKQISNVPKSIFDSVKSLQLSRTDVIKWMNSRMPLSQLDGFFLRLRLGNRESELGGTVYHVACITGVQRESLQQNSRNSIAVDVGGINCLVQSQYISNQDFLEDELMAWWSSTAKGGRRVPSKKELKMKFQEKKLLGLEGN